MQGRLNFSTRLLNLCHLFHRCSQFSPCNYGELLWERKCATIIHSLQCRICFYLISKISIFEESFDFWEVLGSVHNCSHAGISLQFYKCTDCSIRVIKKLVTLNSLRDRSRQNLTGSALPIWQTTSVVHQPVTHLPRSNI